MPCYARACHQRLPCKSMRACQRVWHACEPPYVRNGQIVWICRRCESIWHFADDEWWREPMKADKPCPYCGEIGSHTAQCPVVS